MGFYDEDDPIWGTGSGSRVVPPRGVPGAVKPDAYGRGGLPITPEEVDRRRRTMAQSAVKNRTTVPQFLTPDYSNAPNAPAIGMNRLSEVGPMYSNRSSGMGRMNRYGMGGMSAPGMAMDLPLGHLAPSRVGIGRALSGGEEPMALGETRNGRGPLFGEPLPERGRGVIGRVLGGVGNFVSENPEVTAALVGTGADIWSSIEDRKERERERQMEEERARRRSRAFGAALGSYGRSREG